ncbi:hypothetical protein ADN00_14305 [Ornatilinea apprima]|uniref:Uncharacterized protein n=1 Tax=Ornatilinea apprima TaxID=1134406 RepID=A0A0P6XWP0_9CHLR|nr:hypothetical protein ADN00_14305 [Ornatilinea apprima]
MYPPCGRIVCGAKLIPFTVLDSNSTFQAPDHSNKKDWIFRAKIIITKGTMKIFNCLIIYMNLLSPLLIEFLQ